MIERSGSGSGRPKNTWIRWIQILFRIRTWNTGLKSAACPKFDMTCWQSLAYPTGDEGGNFLVQMICTCHRYVFMGGGGVGTLCVLLDRHIWALKPALLSSPLFDTRFSSSLLFLRRYIRQISKKKPLSERYIITVYYNYNILFVRLPSFARSRTPRSFCGVASAVPDPPPVPRSSSSLWSISGVFTSSSSLTTPSYDPSSCRSVSSVVSPPSRGTESIRPQCCGSRSRYPHGSVLGMRIRLQEHWNWPKLTNKPDFLPFRKAFVPSSVCF
jgi:hypothetical protein